LGRHDAFVTSREGGLYPPALPTNSDAVTDPDSTTDGVQTTVTGTGQAGPDPTAAVTARQRSYRSTP
jgi:hypothetical protein